MLVVVVIIGIITSDGGGLRRACSAATTRWTRKPKRLRGGPRPGARGRHARRAATSACASTRRGYDFLRYDGRNERWDARDRRSRCCATARCPRASRPALRLEIAAGASCPRAPRRPSATRRSRRWCCMASGDLVPFEVRLERAGTARDARDASARVEGKFEVLHERCTSRRR
ncbi:MAG: hypothetical protein MZV65_53750 [Chromatiales bacterium]|nr:hypothetical protein [Chromatiales bacterium]